MVGKAKKYLNTSGDASTLYVDGYEGVVLGGGIVRIRFFEDKWNFETGEFERQFVQNLIVSHENFQDVVANLVTVAEGFRKSPKQADEIVEANSDG